MKMEETAEPEIYDEPLDEPVLEKLDQISKKLDAAVRPLSNTAGLGSLAAVRVCHRAA
jgi:hypothetical protein